MCSSITLASSCYLRSVPTAIATDLVSGRSVTRFESFHRFLGFLETGVELQRLLVINLGFIATAGLLLKQSELQVGLARRLCCNTPGKVTNHSVNLLRIDVQGPRIAVAYHCEVPE